MRSLEATDITFDFNNNIFDTNGLPNCNAQKAITILKHQMAVQKALEMIEVRIQAPPTLGELAAVSGLSRTYFSLIFKTVTGMNLKDYLIRIRFNKAKELLGNVDLKIKQIAYETGFSDPNYFCRNFKIKTGLNPTNWRLRKIITQKNLRRRKSFDRSNFGRLEHISL